MRRSLAWSVRPSMRPLHVGQPTLAGDEPGEQAAVIAHHYDRARVLMLASGSGKRGVSLDQLQRRGSSLAHARR